jgi:hypothetical protein
MTSIDAAQLVFEDLKEALADTDHAKSRRVTTMQQQLDDLANELDAVEAAFKTGVKLRSV